MHRLPARAAALVLGALTLAAGCGGGTTSAVRADDAALGRVVIYRNGVAYYERRAEVVDGKLVLRVPADKIDDFLKSMTVADLETGAPLPVAFPAPGVHKGGVTELVVTLPPRSGRAGKAPRFVKLSYVTEAASWKPSYRVVVQGDRKVELQGWAVVDNTSKEDWRDVKVGVGSSSALAFRYDLRSIRTVQRQTLRDETQFVRAPPRGSSIDGAGRDKDEMLLAAVGDEELARPAGHPDVAEADEAAPVAEAKAVRVASGGGRADRTSAARAPAAVAKRPAYRREHDDKRKGAEQVDARDRWLAALADRLRRTGQAIRIEGFAAAGESEAESRAADRAHLLRNQLIERGVAPAQIVVVGRGVVAGHAAGVRVVALEASAAAPGARSADASAPPVGESHFESEAAMTVAAGTSAMVSIVKTPTKGEVVYLYSPDGEGGDANFAFKAVRFRNNTGSTLDPGPMTVYGAGRFIGEGMADPIPPGALALVPFALDRQVAVARTAHKRDEIAQLVKLSRGVLTTEVRHIRRTELQVSNRGTETATVLIKHHTPDGWTLRDAPEVVEKIGSARIFQVAVEPGQISKLTIEEATPLRRTVDLRSPVGVDLIRLYLATPEADARLKEAMVRVLGHFDAMVKADERIDHLRERANELRLRLDELTVQLASLEGMRRGASLEQHLQRKMRETSEAVQKTTMDIVEAQEQRMLAKVRFADELGELTLASVDKAPAGGGDKRVGRAVSAG